MTSGSASFAACSTLALFRAGPAPRNDVLRSVAPLGGRCQLVMRALDKPSVATMTADGLIKAGFWSQFVLLGLVDWGTLTAFARETVPWYHYVGFFVVNAVLLSMAFVMWRWLKPQRSRNLDTSE